MLNIDKRKYQRIESINVINFTCHDQRHHLIGQGMGKTINLSESGMLIETPMPIEPQNTLSVNIGIDDNLVYFHGKAIHSKQADVSGFRTGVHLLQTQKSGFNAFRNHLKNLRIKAGVPIKARTAQKRGQSLPYVPGPPVDYLYVVEEESYESGSRIIEEGKFGNWVWVILEGNADMVRDTPNGPMTIFCIGPGSFIGNIGSFLTRNYARTSTIIARNQIQLGLLDTHRLCDEYATMSSEMKILLWSLNDRLKRTTDRMTDVLLKRTKSFNFVRKGRLLVRKGQTDGGLYTIAGGKATVVRHTAKGLIPLINLQKGDLVGSLPFLPMGHEPQYASVVASDDLKKITMDAQKVEEDHGRLSLTYQNIVDNMVNRISVTSRMVCDLQQQY